MSYVFTKEVHLTYEEAVVKVTEELKKEGFGVLTEIDVKATLKKKLDVDFNRYIILGACNPHFAYKSLQAQEDIGLLLPCNVITSAVDILKSIDAGFTHFTSKGVIPPQNAQSFNL